MDFKIPGLPHSTVKQLHSASVRELIQKIENHPHRHALQRDLQQSQSFNPFSPESKQMIHEVGNIELCELLDMEPKTQCKVRLSYWDVGIVYCTCGHFLRKGTEENKKFVQYTMDLLSIPSYYIKKGRPHGHRYGKKPGDREYYIAHSLKKKCKKKNFMGIHDRFIRDEKFRKNMFDNGRTEEICRQMDDLADEDHTHHLTPEEINDYRSNWWIRSNKIGSDTMPIWHRSDFKQALSTLRQRKDQEDTVHHNQRWTQSYSSSWLNWQESWWNSSYENHHEDVPSTDWSGQLDKEVIGTLIRGMIFRIHLLCYSSIVYSWRRSTVIDGECKYYTSNTVKIYVKMATRTTMHSSNGDHANFVEFSTMLSVGTERLVEMTGWLSSGRAGDSDEVGFARRTRWRSLEPRSASKRRRTQRLRALQRSMDSDCEDDRPLVSTSVPKCSHCPIVKIQWWRTRCQVRCARWVALTNHSPGSLVEGTVVRPRGPCATDLLQMRRQPHLVGHRMPDLQQFHTIVSLHWMTVKRQTLWITAASPTQRVWLVSVQWVPIWWRQLRRNSLLSSGFLKPFATHWLVLMMSMWRQSSGGEPIWCGPQGAYVSAVRFAMEEVRESTHQQRGSEGCSSRFLEWNFGKDSPSLPKVVMAQSLGSALKTATTVPHQDALTTRSGCESIAHALQGLTDRSWGNSDVSRRVGACDLISRVSMSALRNAPGCDDAFPFVVQFHGQL